MKKFIIETCLIEIKVGDVVVECDGLKRVGVVNSIHLTPNGRPDSKLVCIIVMLHIDKDNCPIKISATSDRFQPYEKYEYDEYYPSQM